MSKMFVLNHDALTYLPDGVHEPGNRAVMPPRPSLKRWLDRLGCVEVLVDLGTGPDWKHTGEFQVWGRAALDPQDVLYPRHICREWEDGFVSSRLLRWTFERLARKWEARRREQHRNDLEMDYGG